MAGVGGESEKVDLRGDLRREAGGVPTGDLPEEVGVRGLVCV